MPPVNARHWSAVNTRAVPAGSWGVPHCHDAGQVGGDLDAVAVLAAAGAFAPEGAGGGLTDLRRYSPDVVYLEQLTSALYLDNPKDVNSYLRAMQRLNTQALTSFETTQFLRQLLKQPLLA